MNRETDWQAEEDTSSFWSVTCRISISIMGCLQRGPQPQSLNGRSQAPSLPVALSIEQNSLMLLLCTPLSHLWRVCMQHRLHPPLRSLTIAPSACLPLQTPWYLQAQCDNTNPFYHAPQRSWQSFQTLLSLSYRCYKKRKIIECIKSANLCPP